MVDGDGTLKARNSCLAEKEAPSPNDRPKPKFAVESFTVTPRSDCGSGHRQTWVGQKRRRKVATRVLEQVASKTALENAAMELAERSSEAGQMNVSAIRLALHQFHRAFFKWIFSKKRGSRFLK